MIVAGPGGTAAGTAKLICDGETKKSGARTPLIVTVVPDSSNGKGCSSAVSVRTANSVPKIEANDSTANGPLRKSAALTAVSGRALTTRMVTCRVSVNWPSLAMKLTVKFLPRSALVGVQRKLPRVLLLVAATVLKVALGGKPEAVIVSGVPEPRSLACTENCSSRLAMATCVSGTANDGATGSSGMGEKASAR